MPDIFIPFVTNQTTNQQPRRIVIDPLTRVEGHLRVEAQIEGGRVVDAWVSSTMFRGIEKVLVGRDPRDAWAIAQRICGVCTTVHSIASVRAVENALGITPPDNARLVRNLMEGAQFIQDHVIHFYHLHALDWVDITAALRADPAATSRLAVSLSPWPKSSAEYFGAVRARLQKVVDSGQLGLFANGYWGHPGYILPAEVNLLAVAHYLEALDWQREYIKLHAILGGKNPHPQTYLVGGMAIPVDKNSAAGINPTRISQMRALIQRGQEFVTQVYLPDVKAIAGFYKTWAALGAGPGNYLSFGDFPQAADGSVASYYLPQGVVLGDNLAAPPQALDQTRITESIAHAWYSYTNGSAGALHPDQGQTTPNYTGPQPPYQNLDTGGKYSWVKAPRYNGQPMEVGPLARVAVAYAAGHARVRELVNGLLSELGLPASGLNSTLGRIAARAVETQALGEQMPVWLNSLEANMNAGINAVHNGTKWDPATWPAGASGWGTTEAPRGALGHWLGFASGKITRYQTIMPTTWNSSPRDERGVRGPFEQSLIGLPVSDPERPVEILRTIHSFDPCMACAVHLLDASGKPTGITVRVG